MREDVNVRVLSARDDPPSALAHHQNSMVPRCGRYHHNVALAMMREGGRRVPGTRIIARGMFCPGGCRDVATASRGRAARRTPRCHVHSSRARQRAWWTITVDDHESCVDVQVENLKDLTPWGSSSIER